MNDYLSKPVRDSELRDALDRCILSEANPSGEEIVCSIPNEPSSGEPVVDTSRLRDVANNEPVLMRRLVNLYLDQTAPMLEDLHTAIETNSSGDVARLAHKLAGSSVSCGVEVFTQPLRELEQLGREGDLTRAATLFDNVREKFPNVRSAFDQFLQTIPGDS
jgi:HPt (histidine-containing phosphotransfer) domain-containing protein